MFVKGNLNPYVRILNIDQFPRMGPRTDRSNAAASVWVYIRGLGFMVFRFCPVPLAHVVLEKEYAHRKATVSFWCQLQEVGI